MGEEEDDDDDDDDDDDEGDSMSAAATGRMNIAKTRTYALASEAKGKSLSVRNLSSSLSHLSFNRNTNNAKQEAGGHKLVAKQAVRASRRANVAVQAASYDQEQFIAESKEMRPKHLEEQAMYALKISCENFDNAVFPNALIAGDVVITHLLSRLGYLKDGKCTVMCVDPFHLFPETMDFLREVEDFYGFKAEVFCAEGIPVGDKAAYDKKYGANLWKEDIDQYDKVCKVEPFQRGLKTLNTDCMINGRTRWQGFERAWIDLFENAPTGGGLAKCNPLAYWTLEDCFDYIAKYKVPVHPSMDERAKVQEEGYTAFVDYEWVGD